VRLDSSRRSGCYPGSSRRASRVPLGSAFGLGPAPLRAGIFALGLAACSVSTPAGDPFPVHVDLTSGPVIAHVARPGEAPIVATVDVLAPFTLIDPGVGEDVERASTELDLFGQATAGSSQLVERARFSVDLVLLHPCDAMSPACAVGDPGTPVPIGAVLGADALGGSAIRFDFAASELFVFPDIAGSNDKRDQECDARFPGPFRGGGTLVLGGADVDFSGRRIAISACLQHGAYQEPVENGGTNALFVVSTGLGPSIIGTTAYERYAGAGAAAGLPAKSVLLPSGMITGGAGSIERLALVANPSKTTAGPCNDLFQSYCLPRESCRNAHMTDYCKSASECGAPAAIEMKQTIDVIVVPDDDPTLQALRAELRPDQAEVDGILGVDALRALELDVDYPGGRLLARCVDGSTCKARPTLGSGQTPTNSFLDCTK